MTGIEKYLKDRDLTMVRYEREGLDAFLSANRLRFGFPAILIAGSNGKGEVEHYLENVYLEAGYRVSAFSKPVPGSYLNMGRINGRPVKEEDFARVLDRYRGEFEKYGLSAFEIEVVCFYCLFEEYGPDIALIECGMGGEGDATNIVDSVASVITSVSLEHTAFLGRTVSEIALNKSGIMRKDTKLVVGRLPEAARDVLVARANDLRCEYLPSDEIHNASVHGGHLVFDYTPYRDLEIATPTLYSALDAGIAVEVVSAMAGRLPVSGEALRKGLLKPGLEGRFEIIGDAILDGAHNPEAMESLTESLDFYLQGKPFHVIFACLNDKNISSIFPIIGKDASSLVLTTFDNPRARREEDYFLYLDDYPFVESYLEAYERVRAEHPGETVLFTGSLAFCYEVREKLFGKRGL